MADVEVPTPRRLSLATFIWPADLLGGVEPSIDPARVAVAGDSAGGNLAAAAAIALLRRSSLAELRAQLLVYPADLSGLPSALVITASNDVLRAAIDHAGVWLRRGLAGLSRRGPGPGSPASDRPRRSP